MVFIPASSAVVSADFDTSVVVQWLYRAYASEIFAWHSYYSTRLFVAGGSYSDLSAALKTIGEDELDDHADKLLQRIFEVGGSSAVISNVETLRELTPCPPIELSSDTITDIQALTASVLDFGIESERCAIDFYKSMADAMKDVDPVTHKIVVEILADEEEHLASLLAIKAE